MSLLDALLIAAIVANGLLAGLFFVFTCAIAPGFRHLDDATYVRAFRAINRAILNGWFLLVFFTAPLATLAYALLGYWRAMESPLLPAIASPFSPRQRGAAFPPFSAPQRPGR